MKYFINKDGKILSYTYSKGVISLYDGEQFVFSSNTNLKNISDAVDPIYYNNYLVIFDYEKGIEIISKASKKLLKLRAVYAAEIFDNILLAIINKKLVVIDYLKCEIIDQYNISENFDFCKADDNILLYRVKRNKSFLYNIKTNQLIELTGLPILDIMIVKFALKKHIVHIFFSHGDGTEQNCGVIEYDIRTNKYIKKDFGSSSAYGYQFIDYFNPKIDEKVEIINKDYGIFIQSLIAKYGLFFAFYLADEKRILKQESSTCIKIQEYFMVFKTLIQQHYPIKSSNDFENLKLELNALEMRIKTYK